MKIALLGSAPIVLEAALLFDDYEAQVTWFKGDQFIDSFFSSVSITWADCTSSRGLQVLDSLKLQKSFLDLPFSWQLWEESYFLPLLNYFKNRQVLKDYKVSHISKRYLAKDEAISGKSRFYDLFRIIYELNPEEFINQQKDANPETYQRLSEEFLNSLQSSLEMYEDFDLVFDFRSLRKRDSVSVTGKALGEDRLVSKNLHQGTEILKFQVQDSTRDIALVGSGEFAAQILIQLEHWLDDPRMRLFVVTDEEDPFASLKKSAHVELKKKIDQVLEKFEIEFQKENEKFFEELRAWQNLDDFIQAKKPKPPEPIPRLVFFSGHNVSAVDQLIDRKRLFLTLEIPDWRKGIKQPENNYLDLKTIGVDEIIVANGFKKDFEYQRNLEDEVGYFKWMPLSYAFTEAWSKNFETLYEIKDRVFKLFSPNDSGGM